MVGDRTCGCLYMVPCVWSKNNFRYLCRKKPPFGTSVDTKGWESMWSGSSGSAVTVIGRHHSRIIVVTSTAVCEVFHSIPDAVQKY